MGAEYVVALLLGVAPFALAPRLAYILLKRAIGS